ncbi:TIGR02757 family protein [Deferribacteraceae bacterium V6Fe1]|nr:TIGR02757 family protein [Deferribacteraceae bacterium V6Fe1]
MKKKVDVNQKSVLNAENQGLLTKNNNLNLFFEKIYQKYSAESYLSTDPIIFPKTYRGNTEYIAFVSSLFAYGQVKLIQNFLKNFFEAYGTECKSNLLPKKNIYYRFQTEEDIYLLVKFLNKIYKDYGSIEGCFYSLSDNIEESLNNFILLAKDFGKENNAGTGYFFLFPTYGRSALKRMRMFLRWMIRDTDIDFGLWKKYNKSELLYPLDTHILKCSKKLQIISSESGTHKNSLAITSFFKKIAPNDPLKFDFPITRLGIVNKCISSDSSKCLNCEFVNLCPFAQR